MLWETNLDEPPWKWTDHADVECSRCLKGKTRDGGKSNNCTRNGWGFNQSTWLVYECLWHCFTNSKHIRNILDSPNGSIYQALLIIYPNIGWTRNPIKATVPRCLVNDIPHPGWKDAAFLLCLHSEAECPLSCHRNWSTSQYVGTSFWWCA